LAGNRSLFQETLLRVAPLVEGGGMLVVVGGVLHRDLINEQLAEAGLSAQVLLEPEPRDSAAAIAAAALWVNRRDPDGVMAYVASDHHIPDHRAFRASIISGVQAAMDGRIVTMGVRPTEPSSAYGYIRPAGAGVSPVVSFVEKPDRALAVEYIDAGYLWNSGNFIVSAKTMITELQAYAPGVENAVEASLGVGGDRKSIIVLGREFQTAPRISIDYAVMEKTQRASVLPVDFSWSDLGAWDAFSASGEGDVGTRMFEDCDGCLVRATDGVMVAALGVRNLAIVVEPDAVLVCDLARAQEVKGMVERMRIASPRHIDFEIAKPETLVAGGRRLADWLRLKALPVWAAQGLSDDGAFQDALTLDARQVATPRRARVQARQIFVYAQAGLLGWRGPWKSLTAKALEKLYENYLSEDGNTRASVSATGEPHDDASLIYDQAFVLFALATAKRAGVDDTTLEARAALIREALLTRVMPNGALREGGSHPFQANAHMHLLEACLAWEGAGGDQGWMQLADQIVELALTIFIDPDLGVLREFFNETWQPAPGSDGRLVEPGHQFEWAWLLTLFARQRNHSRAAQIATALYASGRRGVSEQSQITLDALDEDGSIRSTRARLWPQTEWLKAALIMAESASDGRRVELMSDAAAALRALWLYLTPSGLWRDKRLASGSFIDEPSPASSFYHIMMGFVQLSETSRSQGIEGLTGIDLS